MRTNRFRFTLPGFQLFSLIDVLFSTLGIMIFIAMINLVIAADKHTVHKLEHGQNGSIYWMEPVLIVLGKDKAVVYYENQKLDLSVDSLPAILRRIATLNCERKMDWQPVRNSIVFGIREDGYDAFLEMRDNIRLMNDELRDEYGEFFFALRFGKEPVSGEDLPDHWRPYVPADE